MTLPVDSDKYNYEYVNYITRGPISTTLNFIISFVTELVYFIKWALIMLLFGLLSLIGIV